MNEQAQWSPGGYEQSLNRMHRLKSGPVKVKMLKPNRGFLGWLAYWVLGRKSIETQIEELLVRKASAQEKRVRDLPFRHAYHPCLIGGELHVCMAYGFDIRCPFRGSEHETGSAMPFWEAAQLFGGGN